MILSYAFWRSRFSKNPEILGRKVLLQGRPFEIVGVLPDSFNGVAVDSAPDLRAPAAAAGLIAGSGPDGAVDYEVIGRLRPGVTPPQAEQEIVPMVRQGLA